MRLVTLWLVLIVGLTVGTVLIASGGYLLKPFWHERQTRADAGIAVITSSLIALAIFVLQVLDENRIQREDVRRQREFANQTLRLQLGLTPDLRKMDLSDEDLKEINLPGKDLRDAVLSNAHLEGANLGEAKLQKANLIGAHLEGANLAGAHLEGANLRYAHLEGETILDGAYLQGADLSNANLRGALLYSADLRDAKAMSANFSGASTDGWRNARLQYNSQTVFQNGKKRPCSTPPCFLGQNAKLR